MRDQENYPYLQQCFSAPAKAAKQDAHTAQVGNQVVAPFHFNARRMPIDWRLLHGIDVNKMVSNRQLIRFLSPLMSSIDLSLPIII